MSLWIIYPLLALLLIGVAIYEHVTASRLSVPVSPALTVLAILLPVVAVAHTIVMPSLLRNAKSPGFFNKYLPAILQFLQIIVTTAAATLLASDALPSPIRDCLLNSKWEDMWIKHDANAIRAIQDAFNCCGFRSVVDKAWPFPPGKHDDKTTWKKCHEEFGRNLACHEPWKNATASAAGWDFVVLVGVVLLQVLGWLLVRSLGRDGFSGVWAAFERSFGWGDRQEGEEARSRPLLEDADDAEGERAEYGATRTNANGARRVEV